MPFKFNPFTGKFDVVESAPTPATIGAVFNVAATSVTTETRDGSLDFPFLTIQDAATAMGAAADLADYETTQTIKVLDSANYAENPVLPTRRVDLDFGTATIDGDVTVQIDDAERQGSSDFPNYKFIGDFGTIGGRINGDILFELKSGGTAVNIVQASFLGFTQNGGITMADGTNGGSSITTSLATASFSRYTMATDTFKGREAIVSLSKAVFPDIGTFECRYISAINSGSQLLNQTIEEYGSTSLTRTFTDFTLRDAGSVTWDIKSGSRTWKVDPLGATELINKVTSYPTATPTLEKATAEAIAYDNTTSGLTAEEAQAAIDEISATTVDIYTLAGVTFGDTDLGTFTGTTITDDTDIKTALQELETAVESGGGGGSPGGSDTQVQFNDGGAFGGSSLFTFNKTTGATTINGLLTVTDYLTINDKIDTVALGHEAGGNFDLGTGTIAIGARALYTHTGNVDNTIGIGYQAGYNNIGGENLFMGTNAGFTNTTGDDNIFFGYLAGFSNDTGSKNLAIGTQAGYSLTTGVSNTIIGYRAGQFITTAGYNVSVGHNAGQLLQSGNYNVNIGYSAGSSNVSGQANIMIGFNAGQNNTGNYSIAIGSSAQRYTTGGNNVALGYFAGSGIIAGSSNVSIGTQANSNVDSGTSNIAIGYRAHYNGEGSSNVCLGQNAGYGASGATFTTSFMGGAYAGYSLTTGSANVFIGHDAGYRPAAVSANATTTGANNTFIGYRSGFGSTTQRSNATAIGYNAVVDADDTCVIGGQGSSAQDLIVTKNLTVGIGASGVNYSLTYDGDGADAVVTFDEANAVLQHTVDGSGSTLDLYELFADRPAGVANSSIENTDSASTTSVNVKISQNAHMWDSSSNGITYNLPDLKNVPIGWEISFTDVLGTAAVNTVTIKTFSGQPLNSNTLGLAAATGYDIVKKFEHIKIKNYDGKSWHIIDHA